MTREKKQAGNAAIEFVWSSCILMVVFLVLFQFFQVTYRSSGAGIQAAYRAFSKLGPAGIISASAAQQAVEQGTLAPTQGCQQNCAAKLNFHIEQDPRTYSYGAGQFTYQVEQSFVLYLPVNPY